MPAADSASRSRRAVATEISSSPASSEAVRRPRPWSRRRAATRRSARMCSSWQEKRSGDEYFWHDDGPMEIFEDAAAWRDWLERHAGSASEVWVMLAKKGTVEPTRLTYE